LFVGADQAAIAGHVGREDGRSAFTATGNLVIVFIVSPDRELSVRFRRDVTMDDGRSRDVNHVARKVVA
jgi:hypothetical protein